MTRWLVPILTVALLGCDSGDTKTKTTKKPTSSSPSSSDSEKAAEKTMAEAKTEAEPEAPKKATGPFAPMADLVNEAARNIVAAANGQKHDPKWDGLDAKRDLRGTGAETKQMAQKLGGDLKPVVAVFELEAYQNRKRAYLRSNCAVFSDGRVAWLDINIRRGNRRVPNLLKVAPVLQKGVDLMTKLLREGGEGLPLVGTEHAAALPPSMSKKLRGDASKRAKSAAAAKRIGDVPWEGRLDDITVIAKGSKGWVMLKSSWSVWQDRLVLYPPHVRPIR